MRVRDPETLDGAVEREHVGQVPVVEPEARGRDQDGPVGGVGGVGEGGQEGEEGEGEEGVEFHWVRWRGKMQRLEGGAED